MKKWSRIFRCRNQLLRLKQTTTLNSGGVTSGQACSLYQWVLRAVVFVCAVVTLEVCYIITRPFDKYVVDLIRNSAQITYDLPHPTTPATLSHFIAGHHDKRRADSSSNITLREDDNLTTKDCLVIVGNVSCYRDGLETLIATNSTQFIMNSICQCAKGWHGNECSIPSIVYKSQTPWNKGKLRLRSSPRRIIQAFPFNQEYEMLEMRFAELSDVVDVFLILESNFTAYGMPKPLYLLERLRAGLYANVAHKIVHIFLPYFPEAGRKDGWIADGLHRNYIGTDGLKKISGYNMTDLFILTDADELPRREALQFLRWHDGYSEPISIAYQWNNYGFFWSPGTPQRIIAVLTLGMVRYVFRYKVYGVRSAITVMNNNPIDVKAYLSMGAYLAPWTIGTDELNAGWHCSWCLDLPRIRDKLLSAQNGDFPRWGDYPEKTNLTYIQDLVANGKWFDGRRAMHSTKVSGPRSLMENRIAFDHLIRNKYAQVEDGNYATVGPVIQIGMPIIIQNGRTIRPSKKKL